MPTFKEKINELYRKLRDAEQAGDKTLADGIREEIDLLEFRYEQEERNE